MREWAEAAGSLALDFAALRSALPTEEDRWKGLRFAARMAWKDGYLAVQESEVLDRLAEALQLPEGSLERVIGEMSGRVGGRVDPGDRLVEALQQMKWSAKVDSKPCTSDLTEVLPADVEALARVRIDKVEVLAFYRQGLAARCLEGRVFLAWDDIVTYTRVPVLGAAVQIHTESGRRWTLVDARLGALGRVLDRVFAAEASEDEPSASPAPVVELIHGD